MGDSYKSYSSFYNGGMSSFEPNYGEGQSWGTSTGYTGHAGTKLLGFPGSPQTANQLGEAVNAIKQGVTSFEVTMLTAGTQGAGQAEQIPKQHFEEMRALMKLTGVRPSLHGPIDLDPSGMGQQGFNEDDRQQNERRFFHALENAKKLDTGKNIKVVFHSSAGLPGTEYKPGDTSKGENRWIEKKVPLVNRETGQITSFAEEEKMFYPENVNEGGKIYTIEKRIENQNNTQWSNQIVSVINEKIAVDKVFNSIREDPRNAELFKKENSGEELMKVAEKNPSAGEAFSQLSKAHELLSHTNSTFGALFNQTYKNSDEKQKEELAEMAKKWKKERMESLKDVKNPFGATATEAMLLDKQIQEFNDRIKAPQTFVRLEDFSREKAATTFGNLAWNAYKKLGGEDAPVVAIENMFAGEWVHSTAEGMKKLIDASRNKFIENAKSNGMSESSAKNAAEKLIGATWDVGHLNMMKKHGFTDEDVVKATAEVAPYVKHVHLTDNFGYSDSHLAPGMGNVPIKAILEELEKKGDLAGMNKIVEAGGFVQHFKKSPHGITMAALGSPIYGAKMGPYWSQAMAIPFSGGYFAGPMSYLPENHFSRYGSGFSSLPTEVGGQMPGGNSRFSGAGMA